MAKLSKTIAKRIGKAVFKYKMICPGDRILIAVSGGKDSLTLLHDFAARVKSFPVPFEIEAAHIHTEYCKCHEHMDMNAYVRDLGIAFHFVEVNISARLSEGNKMNCYWCSTQRRMELLKLAAERNCGKIALGHHMDDIIETYLMNIFYRGEVSTMLPHFRYEKFQHAVIRPLAHVPEFLIEKFAAAQGFAGLACTCNHDTRSKRRDIREMIELLYGRDKSVKNNIFKSMSCVKSGYLP